MLCIAIALVALRYAAAESFRSATQARDYVHTCRDQIAIAACAPSPGGLPLAPPWERRRACKRFMARPWLLHDELTYSLEAAPCCEGRFDTI
eukprot:5366529-Pleurochrysis_carterae.AAC.1